MMQDAILNFPKQFGFKPKVVNFGKLKKTEKFVVCGMGGSHLAADLLNTWDPALDIKVHSDYGLPLMADINDRLVILSSYSGNTEETLDAYEEAKKRKKNMAAISIGGKLLNIAEADGIPCVKIPDTGIQPRSALGFSIIGLMKLIGLEEGLKEAGKLAKKLKPEKLEKEGQELSERLKDHVPVIYCSGRNKAIAYNWKIKLNETGKIPAFYNVFPELNHNEMTGFDVKDSVRHLSGKFYFIFLRDKEDHPKIQKRARAMEKLYQDRGLKTEAVEMKGRGFEKMFASLILADWTALYTAEQYGLESEQVPMVEEFKSLIADF